jgi:hypothetical protein
MTVKKTHELKHLQSRYSEAIAKFDRASEGVKTMQREAALHKRQADEIESQIKKLESAGHIPVITEHALLRYFERVLGYDLEAIKSQLITDDIAATVNNMVSGKIPAMGCRLVFKDRVVITLEAPGI